MADWDTAPDIQRWVAGTPVTSGAETSIPAVGTANTKGAWQQLLSAVAVTQTGLLVVQAQAGTTNLTDGCVDIGEGASLSEQVIIPDLLVSRWSSGDVPFSTYMFPLGIGGVQRLAARGSFTTTTGTGKVHLIYTDMPTFSGNAEPGGAVQCLGAGAANGATLSRGTQLDPGTTANTKGAWSQLGSGTAPRSMWAVNVGIGNAGQTHTNGGSWSIDIGIGASLSEQVIVPDLLVACPAGARGPIPAAIGPLPILIPAGVRVAARCSSSIITSDRVIDVALYGVIA